MKKMDVVLGLFFILLASVILFFNVTSRSEGEIALVTKNGEEVAELKLSEDTRYTIDENDEINVIRVEDGYVYMEHANCRDQLCTHYAPINKGPASIVCLPNRVVISIDPEAEGDLDAISQ